MARRFFACFGKGASSEKTAEVNPTDARTTGVGDQATEEQRLGGAVVVELFSSQGCKTSPTAELLVSRLGRGDFNLEIPVIVLAYHVDYWDYMGWRDPYASAQWTVRQKDYVEALGLDAIFTPQAVVQGKTQCIATDEEALLSSIRSASRAPSPTFKATFQNPSPDSLKVTLSGGLKYKGDSKGADLMVAMYESGLVNDCTNGENAGRVLSNDFVVRRLEKVCAVKEISGKKTASLTVDFPLWEGFSSGRCGIAVFVQSNSRQIFGSQSFPLPPSLER